jgi:hypothetical protein
MNDLLQFLSSREAIIVYIVAAISCCLCFIIYLVERNNVKARQRHNTRELNKLVAKVKEEANIVDEPMYDVPILQTIDEDPQEAKVAEMLAETQVLKVVKEPEVEILEESPLEVVEPLEMEPIDILQEAKDAEEEELQYTSIEPDRETAQMELRRITEELQKQEEEPEEVITNYEALQEENAIISMDELVAKGKAMYDANELTQYVEEGNEPISISELEQQYGREAAPVNEPFEIDKVVPDEEIEEEVQEVKPVVVEPEKKFKSSPIISPIFGIERQADDNVDIALENTANYDKLDQEIQKTNEFLMTLKDLQQKVD